MTRNDEVKHIAETVYGYMQEAYDEGFEAGTKTTQECSWEKGVRDAWEYIRDSVETCHEIDGLCWDAHAENIRSMLNDLDPVIYTKDYVESRNKEDLAKTKPIEVGDVVRVPSNYEGVVTHIDENDWASVLYTENHCTDRWHKNLLQKTGRKAVVKIGELK